jgi:hypothetical protein
MMLVILTALNFLLAGGNVVVLILILRELKIVEADLNGRARAAEGKARRGNIKPRFISPYIKDRKENK